MACTVRMDCAPGFAAFEFVALFTFALVCLFCYTAHDLTASVSFTWTCNCLQAAVFTSTAMRAVHVNKCDIRTTNCSHHGSLPV